jgi:cation transport ATPase
MVGDLLRVVPAEKVPVDGEVVEGHSRVEEFMVNGVAVLIIAGVGMSLSSVSVISNALRLRNVKL